MRMRLSLRILGIDEVVLLYFLTFPILRNLFVHIPYGYGIMLFVFFMLMLYSIVKDGTKKYIDVYIYFIILFILFFFKFAFNESMKPWLTREFGVQYIFIVGGIFGYPVMRIQRYPERMIITMKLAGIILGAYYLYKAFEVINTGFWTYFQFGREWHERSNMSWSYGVLLVICLLSIYVILEKKYLFMLPIGLSVIGIMSYGSRGTVIAIALGVLFAILLVNEGKMTIKNYIFLFVLIGLVIFVFSDFGLSVITTWFRNHGLSSRFLELLTVSQTLDVASSGRTLIWLKVIDLINDGSLLGHGVFGERNLLYNSGYLWGYSHNIFLEILVAFGKILGSVLIGLMVFGIIRLYRSSDNKVERLIVLIFLTTSFELFLSNTIWFHYGPWCLLGLYYNHFHKKDWQKFDNSN